MRGGKGLGGARGARGSEGADPEPGVERDASSWGRAGQRGLTRESPGGGLAGRQSAGQGAATQWTWASTAPGGQSGFTGAFSASRAQVPRPFGAGAQRMPSGHFPRAMGTQRPPMAQRMPAGQTPRQRVPAGQRRRMRPMAPSPRPAQKHGHSRPGAQTAQTRRWPALHATRRLGPGSPSAIPGAAIEVRSTSSVRARIGSSGGVSLARTGARRRLFTRLRWRAS